MNTKEKNLKHRLIKNLTKQYGFRYLDAKLTYNVVLQSIFELLEEKGECLVTGIGRFYLKKRNGLIKTSLMPGGQIELKDRIVLNFKPSAPVRKRINKKED